MKKLGKDFYREENVVRIARELLGKVLMTNVDGMVTGGIITEAEAYNGVVDKACHAYGGRRTPRTEVMYSPGGMSYVYLCYGMYSLFNVITGRQDVPHAVLIRAIQPMHGVEVMAKRRKLAPGAENLAGGPGTLSIALGIHYKKHNGLSLLGRDLWIEEHTSVKPSMIQSGPRIGVESAGKDALLPYRFVLKL